MNYVIYVIGIITNVVQNTNDLNKRFKMGKMVSKKHNQKEHIFKHYAVSTDSPVCSRIGKHILDIDGTAVDAAISALFCLGVVHPHSSGIGGGGFMVMFNNTDKYSEFVDFRETAPFCSNSKMAHNNPSTVSVGGMSVAVPGELKGYYYAWKKHSKLEWPKLVEPAIKLLETGVVVDEALGIAIERWKNVILKEKSLKFLTINNTFLKKGQIYKNPKLLKTLKLLSKYGPDLFYNNFSRIISNEIIEKSGCTKASDIRNYSVSKESPIRLKWGKLTVLLSPAPTSGPLLGFILNIFAEFNFKPQDLKNEPVKVYHALIETFKFAFGQRMKLSDPKYDHESSIVIQIITQVLKKLVNKRYAHDIYKKIDLKKVHNSSYYGDARCNPLKTGTTHMVIIDKHKNVVSATSTINGYFGAKYASNQYGFIYNNEMDDFCFPNISNSYLLPPNPHNFPQPGKRPFSSSVPTIILDDSKTPIMAVGASGGSIITTATAQVIIYHLIFGMSLKEAIDHPRLHAQLTPDIVYFETKFDKNIIKELIHLGHKVEIGDVNHGVVQGLARLPRKNEWLTHSYKKVMIHDSNTHIYAESDYRKGGESFGL